MRSSERDAPTLPPRRTARFSNRSPCMPNVPNVPNVLDDAREAFMKERKNTRAISNNPSWTHECH
jgi:hypothetical protein